MRFDGDPEHRSRYALARDGSRYAVRAGKRVRVVDANGKSTEHELGLEGTPIALSNDGLLLGGAWKPKGGRELVVSVLALPKGEPAWTATIPDAGFEFVDFAPRGKHFAVRAGFAVRVFDEAGRKVVGHLLTGRLKIDGMIAHPVLLMRLTKIMSVV